ncbi:hypothetical protein [Pseudomonas sp. F1002]|uniref:hypothetical protein n=1 Tax=Pseudomonas sp. F1002 TaxID=2738821 RepID=UPI00159FDCD6|nr:hypothetical protein [Pseudomonas sp. F1002]NWB63486.1 hypothetical protein [Pseudomonas sp. F1002]
MPRPTDQQVAALALPGDSWEQARARARRLLTAVVACEPCWIDGCGGWVYIYDNNPLTYCQQCSLGDLWNYDPLTGRERPDL